MKIHHTDGALTRLAHISLGLEMGGMEKLLVEFARHADRERFKLHFFCLEERGDLADEVESLGWPVATLGKRPGIRPGLALRLAWRLRRLGIDVVHTHNPPACIYGVPAARLARVPAALNTRHGQGARPGTRQARLLTWSARLAHRVVCVSRDSADVAVQYGIPHERVTTILNGIDLERFAYRGPCVGGPAILVARLAPEKDIATLVPNFIDSERFRPGPSPPLRLGLALPDDGLVAAAGVRNEPGFCTHPSRCGSKAVAWPFGRPPTTTGIRRTLERTARSDTANGSKSVEQRTTGNR